MTRDLTLICRETLIHPVPYPSALQTYLALCDQDPAGRVFSRALQPILGYLHFHYFSGSVALPCDGQHAAPAGPLIRSRVSKGSNDGTLQSAGVRYVEVVQGLGWHSHQWGIGSRRHWPSPSFTTPARASTVPGSISLSSLSSHTRRFLY